MLHGYINDVTKKKIGHYISRYIDNGDMLDRTDDGTAHELADHSNPIYYARTTRRATAIPRAIRTAWHADGSSISTRANRRADDDDDGSIISTRADRRADDDDDSSSISTRADRRADDDDGSSSSTCGTPAARRVGRTTRGMHNNQRVGGTTRATRTAW